MLAKTYRLSSQKDFARIRAVKGSYRAGPLSLKVMQNSLSYSRFACKVPTTVSKKATVRNTLRRRLYTILEEVRPRLAQGFDCVLFTYKGSEQLDWAALQAHVYELLARSRLSRS